MTKPALDRDRLLKLLAMLGSPNDGEVLNAARMALKLIDTAGYSWERLLGAGLADAPLPELHAEVARRSREAAARWFDERAKAARQAEEQLRQQRADAMYAQGIRPELSGKP